MRYARAFLIAQGYALAKDNSFPEMGRAGAGASPLINRWWIVVLLYTASMINYMDRATLSIALPVISDDLHLGPTAKGVLASAFFWSYAYMQIPIGWAADRFNLKWLYAAMFALWSLACGLAGFATSLWMLVAFRLMLGFGESIYLPGGMKIISRLFPPQQRGFPSGFFDFGTRTGLVLDGILIPWLIVTYGWRSMFWIVGFTALLWLVPWIMTPSSAISRRDETSPTTRAASRSNAPAALLYPILLILSPLIYALRAMFPEPFARARGVRALAPLLEFFDLLMNRNLLGIVLGFFCFDYFWYVMLTWLPDYLVKGRGLPIKQAGLLAAITFFIFGITEPLGGWIADTLIRRGWNETRTRKGILTVAWVMGLLVIPAGLTSDITIAIPLLFAAALVGLGTGNLLAILQSCAPPDKVGIWTGVKNYSGNVGGILAPLVMGVLISRTGSYVPGFAVGAIILISGLIPYWLVVGELKPPPERAH
jgi:ACS family D-galactonate transporter-like MFS transporter